jgi:phosphoenolpyruvate carboxykinase (ATP)
MPRHPSVYAELLGAMMEQHGSQCWLVNTGWTGGSYGEGSRMPIKATRALLNAALEGRLDDVEFVLDPAFGLMVPKTCEGVDPKLLLPRNTWADPKAYDEMAAKLASMFAKNFEKFADNVPGHIADAGISAAA